MPENGNVSDVWVLRLHLIFEFAITICILFGSFLVVISQETSAMADSGAAAVVTLVVGYWFGRRDSNSK